MMALKRRITEGWNERIKKTGYRADTLANILEQAGAAGTIASRWSSGWGVNKVFGTKARKAVVVDMSLEDYNLLFRLTESGNTPLVRVDANAKFLGAVPAFNTIAEIRGTEKPDEYIVLSAHFDSWEAGSGATDNGTGSITMMEAARLLRKYYPNPKRTIIVGLWGSEEQGLNGSRAFVKDHPEVIDKLQASFNQDNGTGRVQNISAQGLVDAGASLARWISRVPGAVTQHIKLSFPGMPGGGGSDYASFVAAGAPGFSLSSLDWDYFLYTWHTQRDTYDKLVFDDLKNNVVLVACLAYMASEDPEFTPRVQRAMPMNPRTNEPREWPPMRDANRNYRLD
jgi:Iap family predicted aminopeptidase